MSIIRELLTIAVTLVLLDSIFIMAIKKYFDWQIMIIQGSHLTLNIAGAVGCYIFLIFAIYHFIIKKNASVLDSFLLGASIYGVYEFTNYATLKNWQITTIIMDTTWGGILFASTTYITRFLDHRLLS
jgi:uncharacterized membrane protein